MANSGRRKRDDEALAIAYAAGKTLRDAAAAAGIAERTATRRWADKEFRARVAELQSEMTSRAMGTLADGMADAGTVLRKLLDSKSESVSARVERCSTWASSCVRPSSCRRKSMSWRRSWPQFSRSGRAMNNKRVDNLLAQTRELQKAMSPPRMAWEDALDVACDQLDGLVGGLTDAEYEAIVAVVVDRCRQVQYAKGFPVFNEAQSAMFVRWLNAFPRLLSLTPANLRSAVLMSMAGAIGMNGVSRRLSRQRDLAGRPDHGLVQSHHRRDPCKPAVEGSVLHGRHTVLLCHMQAVLSAAETSRSERSPVENPAEVPSLRRRRVGLVRRVRAVERQTRDEGCRLKPAKWSVRSSYRARRGYKSV